MNKTKRKTIKIQIFTSRYENATANSFSSLASSMRLNSSVMVRYMTPGSFCEPSIVCVLPAPVAPYANTAIEMIYIINKITMLIATDTTSYYFG